MVTTAQNTTGFCFLSTDSRALREASYKIPGLESIQQPYGCKTLATKQQPTPKLNASTPHFSLVFHSHPFLPLFFDIFVCRHFWPRWSSPTLVCMELLFFRFLEGGLSIVRVTQTQEGNSSLLLLLPPPSSSPINSITKCIWPNQPPPIVSSPSHPVDLHAARFCLGSALFNKSSTSVHTRRRAPVCLWATQIGVILSNVVIDMFVAEGRRRWFLQLLLHMHM